MSAAKGIGPGAQTCRGTEGLNCDGWSGQGGVEVETVSLQSERLACGVHRTVDLYAGGGEGGCAIIAFRGKAFCTDTERFCGLQRHCIALDLGARQGDGFAAHIDTAAGCLECAGDGHGARRTAIKHDGAIFHPYSARLDNAIHGDDRVHHISGGSGGHQHTATIGTQGSRVGDEGFAIRRGFGHHAARIEGDQAIPIKIEREALGAAECHPPKLGNDEATVFDTRRHQGRNAGVPHSDGALIDNAGARNLRWNGESVAAGHKVFIGNVRCRCDQSVDVNLRRWTEQNAGRVDQEYGTVGRQGAKEFGQCAACHAIEGDGIRRALNEARRLSPAQGKAVPIDNDPAARLLNHGGHGIWRGDGRVTGHNRTALRAGKGGRGKGHQHGQERGCPHDGRLEAGAVPCRRLAEIRLRTGQ